jgi:hypothetical protein
MRQSAILLSAVAILAACTLTARAGSLDLYDVAVSTSTGVSGDWQDLSTTDPFTIFDGTSTITETTGLAGSCCGDASGGTTPGIGTINYTFNPGAAGTYNVSIYADYDVAVPNYNEYGVINNAGAAQAGVVGEIFNANVAPNDIALFGATGTAGGETYGLANGSNEVPGTSSNYNVSCAPIPSGTVSSSCNADVGMALTYTITLNAGQDALITATSSAADPGGFSLETIHPVDSNNASVSEVYLTGSYAVQNLVSSGTPEPSTWLLMGTALALLMAGGARRRKARA